MKNNLRDSRTLNAKRETLNRMDLTPDVLKKNKNIAKRYSEKFYKPEYFEGNRNDLPKKEKVKKSANFNKFLRNPKIKTVFKLHPRIDITECKNFNNKSKIRTEKQPPDTKSPTGTENNHLKSIIKHLLQKVENLENLNKKLQNSESESDEKLRAQSLYLNHLESCKSFVSSSDGFESDLQKKYVKLCKDYQTLESQCATRDQHYSTLYSHFCQLYNYWISQSQ